MFRHLFLLTVVLQLVSIGSALLANFGGLSKSKGASALSADRKKFGSELLKALERQHATILDDIVREHADHREFLKYQLLSHI